MQEGISLKDLTENEEFKRFEKGRNYIVKPGIKHQIVHDEACNDIGVVISRNGRNDFRIFDRDVVYWYAYPYAYIVSKPFGDNIEIIC